MTSICDCKEKLDANLIDQRVKYVESNGLED